MNPLLRFELIALWVGLTTLTLPGCDHGSPHATQEQNPPVIHLPMEDTFEDIGPNRFATKPIGDEISFAPGVHGHALFVGGSDDWLELQLDDRLSLSKGGSLECWVKRDDWANPYGGGSGGQTLVTCDPLTIDLSVHNGRNPNQNTIRATVNIVEKTRTTLTSNRPLAPGVWTHLAVVYDPETKRAILYIDGIEAAAEENVASPLTKRYVNPLKVGTWYKSNQAFRGWIDEVKLYDYPKSAQKIAEAARR